MIVSDESIEAALDYLAQDPHPSATALWQAIKAKLDREALFADLFAVAEGKSIDAKKCWVERQAEYQEAKQLEAGCQYEVARHKARTEWADTVTRLYQTAKADARASERVR